MQCDRFDLSFTECKAFTSSCLNWITLAFCIPFIQSSFAVQLSPADLRYLRALSLYMYVHVSVCVFMLPYISWFKAQFDFWVNTEKCNNLRITKQLCTHTYINPWERICLYLLTVRSETRKNIGLADEMQIPWIWYEDCNMIHMLCMRIYYITFI